MEFSSRQLVHFLTVLETSSFLKASSRLNVTQPALSKSIKTLEDRLGVSLFERLSRGVRPTLHGLAFETYARRILVYAQRASLEMNEVSAGAGGRVILGVGAPYLEFVQNILMKFFERYPHAQVEIVSGAASDLGKLLIEGKVDIVLSMYNGIHQDDIRNELLIEHLATDEFVGICPVGHPTENKINPPENLAQFRWALPQIERSAMNALLGEFASKGIRFPAVSLTADSMEVLRFSVVNMGMLSLVPAIIANYFGSSVGKFKLSGFSFERNIGIVYKVDFNHSEVHEFFLSMIRANGLRTEKILLSEVGC